MVSQVCCSGCVEVAPHSTGAVLVMETNHRKEGRQSSSTHVPGDCGGRCSRHHALLKPTTGDLVAYPCMAGCFQTMLRQAGLSPATRLPLLKR